MSRRHKRTWIDSLNVKERSFMFSMIPYIYGYDGSLPNITYDDLITISCLTPGEVHDIVDSLDDKEIFFKGENGLYYVATCVLDSFFYSPEELGIKENNSKSDND